MKNKEELKNSLKYRMSEEIDRYVDLMDKGFQGEKFDISEIEKLWGNAIEGCKTVLQDGTEQMLNTVVEKDIISKKKQKQIQYLILKIREKEV